MLCVAQAVAEPVGKIVAGAHSDNADSGHHQSRGAVRDHRHRRDRRRARGRQRQAAAAEDRLPFAVRTRWGEGRIGSEE